MSSTLQSFADYISGLGPRGSIVFVIGYAILCVAFVPASFLTIVAGALFGLVKGVALVFLGALLGSTAAFVISRYAVRDAMVQKLRGNRKFEAIDRAIGEKGGRIVLLLRLSPVFPFSLLNYALGLTRVTLRDYLLASVGMLPGTILYVYSGSVIGDVASIVAGTHPPRGPGAFIVVALGLLATAAVVVIVTRTARAALRTASPEVVA